MVYKTVLAVNGNGRPFSGTAADGEFLSVGIGAQDAVPGPGSGTEGDIHGIDVAGRTLAGSIIAGRCRVLCKPEISGRDITDISIPADLIPVGIGPVQNLDGHTFTQTGEAGIDKTRTGTHIHFFSRDNGLLSEGRHGKRRKKQDRKEPCPNLSSVHAADPLVLSYRDASARSSQTAATSMAEYRLSFSVFLTIRSRDLTEVSVS